MAINRFLQSSVQSGLPKFDSVWDGRSAVGAMEPISAITLSAAQGTIEFNNIPQTYTHLHIRALSQVGSTNDADFSLRFNADSGSNYTKHQVYGDGSTAGTAGTAINQTGIAGGISLNAVGDAFGTAIIDILDYTNTNKNKTVRVLTGRENNTAGAVFFRSGLWINTAAITTISIYASSAATLINTYSSFALYGIK